MRRDDREGGREGKSGRRGWDCVSERVKGGARAKADGSAQRKGVGVGGVSYIGLEPSCVLE